MANSIGAVSNDTMINNIEEIMMLAQERTKEGRGKLDNVLADVLSHFRKDEYDKRHEASRVIHKLLKKASIEVRTMLAQRLAVEPEGKVPSQLLLALANDEEIKVAKPILVETKMFDDRDWAFVINSTNSAHWQIIAQRHDLTSDTVNLLINQRDEDTAVVLLNNHALVFKRDMIEKLGKYCFSAGSLHKPILARQEIDMKVATELYWVASRELRAQIIERFNIDRKTIDKALEGILAELMGMANNDYDVTPDIALMAKRYGERREINSQFLTKTLRNGQVAFFIALFSEYTSLPLNAVHHVLIQEGAKDLAVICKAKGIMKSDFAAYFLMTRCVRPGEKKVNQGELSIAMAAYDSVRREDSIEKLNDWVAKPDKLIR